MTDIFLSYAKRDGERARRLVPVLEAHGWSVFWDQRIPPGKSFARHIQQEIDDASCVVVLWTEHSVGSEWVQIEAAWAQRTHKLIPVLMDRVAERIPIEFSQIEASDLTDWHDGQDDPELLLLFHAIAGHVGPRPEPPRAPTPAGGPETDGTRWRSRKVLLLGSLAVLVVAGMGFLAQYPEYLTLSPSRKPPVEPVAEAPPVVEAPRESEAPSVPEAARTAAPQPVEVEVTPSDAVVALINGTEDDDWKFRHRKRLPIGQYRFEISRPGFETAVRDMEISEGSNLLRVALVPIKARLFVNTDTDEQRITIIAKGSTAVLKYQPGMPLEWGDYEVEVSSPGFDPVNFEVGIRDIDVLTAVSLDQDEPSAAAGASRSLHIAYNQFPGVLRAVAGFTPEGRALVAFDLDNRVEIWDVDEHKLLLELPVGSVSAMALDPDAKVLALATRESPLIQLWATDSGRPLHTISSHHEATIRHLAFSPDGSRFASSADFPDRGIEVWDLPSIERRQHLVCDSGQDHHLAFSGDAKRLAVACHGKIRIYDVESGNLLRIFEKSGCCAFESIAYSLDGAWVAGGSGDGTVESWKVATGESGLVYGGYIVAGAGPYVVAFTPDAATLLSGYNAGWVDLWDVATGASKGFLLGHDDTVGSIAFAADGMTIATSSKDGSARIWSLAPATIAK